MLDRKKVKQAMDENDLERFVEEIRDNIAIIGDVVGDALQDSPSNLRWVTFHAFLEMAYTALRHANATLTLVVI